MWRSGYGAEYMSKKIKFSLKFEIRFSGMGFGRSICKQKPLVFTLNPYCRRMDDKDQYHHSKRLRIGIRVQ